MICRRRSRVLADFLHRTYSVKRARVVLAIALNFCLLYAIGLGTIDAAVRLRNCDRASASRIRALSLTLNIHTFTSRRAGAFQTNRCTTRATSPSRKADKGQARLRSGSEILQRQRCHDTTVNDGPSCLTDLCHRQERASEPGFCDVQQSQNRHESRSQTTCAAAEV